MRVNKCLVTVSLSLFSALALACLDGLEMKVGQVTLNAPVGSSSGGTTINFRQIYTVPPLVFILPSNSNPDPTTIRLLNVTASSFTVGSAESEGEDGVTPAETFRYLAIEPGNYTIGGLQFQAGSINLTNFQSAFGGSSYATLNFAPAFAPAVAPIVVHELQSFANDPTYNFIGGTITQPWLETIGLQASVTNASMSIALERAETSAGSIVLNETIAYFAATPGAGTFVDNGGATINYNAFTTANNITGNCVNNPHGLGPAIPVAVASQATRAGNNGGWLRECAVTGSNIQLQVEEDRANDAEQSHINETAAIFAVSQAFDANLTASGGPRFEMASGTNNAQLSGGGTLNFTNVSFPRAFRTTPLIFSLPTTQGNPPASLRIHSASVNGFQIAQMESEGEAGAHAPMTVDYIAVTPGTHSFPDSTAQLEASSVSTSVFQGNQVAGAGWLPITFSNTYTSAPSLLLDIQTINSEPGMDPSNASIPWLETAVQSGSLNATSASIALERAQTNSGSISAEQIAFLASAAGQSVNFTAVGGNNITMKTQLTADNISGFDNGCFTNNFTGGAFSGVPLVVANQVRRDGGDGGWLRRCSLTPTAIGLTVDEDRDLDSERSHTTEQAALIAFSQAFEWCPARLLFYKNTAAARDPVNATSNPKAIPGALQSFTVRVDNESGIPLSSDSVQISDAIPSGTSLFVQSSVNYPETPFIFTDGSGVSASGLGFSYLGVGSGTDAVEFSNDNGATWTYTPVPDGDGFDSNISNVRFSPTGTFNGMLNNSDVTTFSLSFAVRVD